MTSTATTPSKVAVIHRPSTKYWQQNSNQPLANRAATNEYRRGRSLTSGSESGNEPSLSFPQPPSVLALTGMERGHWWCAWLGLWLAVSPSAQAQDGPELSVGLSPVQIRGWSAPPECPESRALLDAVAAELTAAPPTELGEVTVAVAIERRESRFVLRLTLGAGERREVEGDSCQGVIEAAALTLAMALEVADDPSRGSLEVAAPPPPGPAPPAPEVVFRRSRSDVAGAVRIGWTTEAGLLPGFGQGLELGAGIAVAQWRIDAGVGYWFQQRTNTGAPGAEIAVLAVPVRGCRQVLSTLRLSGCLGLEVGVFQARGIGVTQTREDSALLFAPTMGFSAAQRLTGPLWLRAFVAGSVLLRRPSFAVLPDRELFTPARIGARVLLATEVFF